MPQLEPLDRCCPSLPVVRDRCWLIPRQSTCIVQLGCFGDLLLLFPAFKLMFEQTRIEPTVMVAREYSSVFDGISYATPWEVSLTWWRGTTQAKRKAEMRFDHVIVPQYWNDIDAVDTLAQSPVKGQRTWRAHGRTWKVESETPDFGTAMWNRLGFTRAQMMSEPLVLDRRSPEREEELAKRYLQSRRRTLLYNFTGICSPFGYVPEMMRLLSEYRTRFNLVDIGKIKAHRIYDLLGLYDRAAGLITIDTATCHLAPASKVPTIWFTVDSTGTSVPRGTVALHCKYSETPKRLGEIRSVLNHWYGNTFTN